MFISIPQKKALLVFLTLAATSALAAESVDVKVSGTISPAACMPAISGGGIIDYGMIKADTLSADSYTTLEQKTLNFSISCKAPTKVYIHMMNGRPGTTAGADEGAGGAAYAPTPLFNIANYPAVGLGVDGTVNIGGYGLALADVSADSKDVSLIYMIPYVPGWHPKPNSSFYTHDSDTLTSWSEQGSTIPLAFENLQGKIQVEAYLNKGSELDLTHDIQLDGLSTLELYYQ
ncbi:DUF1120 domain-containing protein [Enterobacteriaceae bacterium H11S18]|uniref:DUF1120 domain-containing protein n=1 Tax=Dryocola clanedunensis TaxID=2925396 RepID=UPI0022F0A456|nr:DUF1120 domain-containing protein [Dryocola clanedunensis]MCT4704928.1 DUF1120 domain-containing protein [Dryocola clanedunensis]MCT4712079.1 DUF1120 domain-containing protein [Dryocola clanedunensis]